MLLQLTRQYDVSPSHLILQLTPHTDPADLPLLRQLAERLHGEGFKLALNHFGRGTVSLDLIQTLPIDMIKMEGEFSQQLENNPKINSILSAFIQMAKELHLHLIFDGIQNGRQLELLRELGAHWWAGPYAGLVQKPDTLFSADETPSNGETDKK